MKSYAVTLLLTAIFVLSGCATPDRVRGHILQPTDRTLPTYQDNLVILDVQVSTDEGVLKLYDVGLRDTSTGLPWRLALFSNSILRTQALPFELKGDAVHHTLVLDLPAGTYEVTSLQFKDYIVNLTGVNVSQTYERSPPKPLFFEVVSSSQPQYLGTLNFQIDPYVVSQSQDGASQILSAAHAAQTTNKGLDPGGTDAVLGAAATTAATNVQTLSGTLVVTVVAPDEASAMEAGKGFRALTNVAARPGRMWLQPAND